MKFLPASLGAEPKKVAILCGLLAVFGVVYYINRTPDSASSSSPSAASLPSNPAPIRQPRAAADSITPMPPQRTRSARGPGAGSIQDFKPTLKLPEDIDAAKIDPALHLDLIAKLRDLPAEGGERSLFDFGAAPKPKSPPPAVAPIKPGPAAPPASAGTPAPPVAPPKPGPPPIPLKFYGYVSGGTGSTDAAFFLDGDDIFVARENDVIQNRYRVVRISVNSAVVEDTSTKNQQTLPLVEELPG